MKKLLVVDMQKGFVNKNNKPLIKRIANLIDKANFDLIVATKFENFTNSQYEKWLRWTKIKSETEQEIVSEIASKVDVVISKTSYSLPDEELKKWFHIQDEVYLCGTDYDACVLAIAFQLFDHNIRPYILIDCVDSYSIFPIDKEVFEKICVKNFGADCIKYKLKEDK